MKNINIRALSAVLALIVCFALLPASALADKPNPSQAPEASVEALQAANATFMPAQATVQAIAQTPAQLSSGSDIWWSKASPWAVPELEKARDLGLIPASLSGLDFTKAITRSEFAAVSVKLYEYLAEKTAVAAGNPFSDTSDPEVLKAYNLGLTNGTSADKFSPDQFLSREQASTMLTRNYKAAAVLGWTLEDDANFPLVYTKPAAFADNNDISAWAKDSVYFMAAAGIVLGMGDNKFSPQSSITREQALAIAVRMANTLKGTTPEIGAPPEIDAPKEGSVSEPLVGKFGRSGNKTITTGAKLSLDKTTFAPGEKFTVRYSGLTESVFIGETPGHLTYERYIHIYLTSVAEPNKYLYNESLYYKDGESGTLEFIAPDTPGAYQVRMLCWARKDQVGYDDNASAVINITVK